MFDITGKVALVTGGATGIGFEIVKALFQNGLRACTIADINKEVAQQAIKAIDLEFGANKVIFVQTDVVDKSQYEAAFKATVEKFKNVDILVNNAGIMNDCTWERSIQINIAGVVNGILLGMENYLQKYRSGNESVILNIASIVAVDGFNGVPIYTCTKCAVLGLTSTFGSEKHYSRTQVKVLAICPGITVTALASPELIHQKTLGPDYVALFQEIIDLPQQGPESVATAAVTIIKEGQPRSVWVAEGGEPPYELEFPTRHNLRKK